MKLIIFDLDQTLFDAISIHDAAAEKTFLSFFGLRARLTEIDFAGKSLLSNFSALALIKNIPVEKVVKNQEKLLKVYEENFINLLPSDISSNILPGVRPLLEELTRTDNILALYTGSSRAIVEKVFTASGLGRYFRFCFYGTEVGSRADMIRLAISEAEKMTGRKFENRDIVIVGDSTRDIECGKQFGAISVAVATGFHTKEQLAILNPDFLFDDMRNYRAVIKAISG